MVRAELAMAIILPDTGEGKERNSAEKSPAGPIGILAARGRPLGKWAAPAGER
jgi:hypothetical protein